MCVACTHTQTCPQTGTGGGLSERQSESDEEAGVPSVVSSVDTQERGAWGGAEPRAPPPAAPTAGQRPGTLPWGLCTRFRRMEFRLEVSEHLLFPSDTGILGSLVPGDRDRQARLEPPRPAMGWPFRCHPVP